jgi:hypothetical protein
MTKMLHTEIKSGERLVATDITNLTFFPKGAILTFSTAAWSATSAEFKNIWKICNTANHQADPNVPDLTNRFLRGGASSDFTTGGGADSQSVFLQTANLPAHNHEATGLSLSGLSASGLSIATSGGHTHSFSGTTSTAGAHSHTYTKPILYQGDATASETGGEVGAETANTSSTGNHNHTFSGSISESGSHSHTIGGSISGGDITGSTANTGSGTAFSVNTVPAYYTVIYIMKVV